MMTDQEIAALAKATVPFVRQCVAETVAKSTALPPELAEQVASAVRLLHESPPIEQRAVPQPTPPARVARIEHDENGNFVPVYE